MEKSNMGSTRAIMVFCLLTFIVFYGQVFYLLARAIGGLAYNHIWMKLKGVPPGGCDTACTLALLPPGFTVGGLVIVFVVGLVFISFILLLFWKSVMHAEESERPVTVS